MDSSMLSSRPWGSFIVLVDTDTYKVKELTVLPEKRLSLQRHYNRSEHWFVLSGGGLALIEGASGKLHEFRLGVGDSVDIPQGYKHRLVSGANGLVVVEIQTGTSFSEDDIERFDDDFGRV